MKKIIGLVSLLVLGVVFTSMSFLKTQLQVSVLDDAGNFQVGAEVTLFQNAKDYESNKAAMKSQKTDKKGRTKFVGLDPVDYFILVKKGNKDNVLGGERTGSLTEGKINKVNIIISE